MPDDEAPERAPPEDAGGGPWIPTGVEGLDRWLGGGLAPGSLVALVADPDSPSEEVCYPPADTNPSRYLSTLRPADEVREHAHAVGFGGFEPRYVDGTQLADDPAEHLSGLEPESVVVVDPVTELERQGREEYASFLSTVKRAVRNTESVAVLHCLRMNPRALQRDLTLARADTVLELGTYVEGEHRFGGQSWTTLAVRKSRFGHRPRETLDLAFRDGPVVVSARNGRGNGRGNEPDGE